MRLSILSCAFVVSLIALPLEASDALKGTFEGASNHVTSGTVYVTTDSIDFHDDFSFDGAPDPKIGFGKDGEFDASTIIEPLKANNGAQSYAIPDSVDLKAYNEVYVWCEKYSVPLGVARLQ